MSLCRTQVERVSSAKSHRSAAAVQTLPAPSSSLAPAAAPPSSSYQSQSLYTLLPPSPTRHLKNTTIIPALLCLPTCFVCTRFFPLFVNLPPLENQIESGWRVWLDTGFAAAARWLWIMRWWKYSPTLNTRQYFCINYMSAQNMPRVLFNIYNLTCFECEANQSICCWKFTIL